MFVINCDRFRHLATIAGLVVLLGYVPWLEVTEASDSAHDESSLHRAYTELVEATGDADLSQEQRGTAAHMLSCAADRDLIPILIAHLDDRRVFHPAMNGPSGPIFAEPHLADAGTIFLDILLRLISGGHEIIYEVENWNAWWDLHKHKSLSDIVTMVRAECMSLDGGLRK